MKLRLCLVFTALCLVIGCFTACGKNDKDTTSKAVSEVTSATSQTIMEDIVSESDKVEDKIESAVDDVKSKVEEPMDKSTVSEPVSDASLNDASLSVSALPTIDLATVADLSTEFHGWGQGVIVDDNNVPVSCNDFQSQFGSYNADFIKDTGKTIYLTFDEGYENGFTDEILDTLKEKKCPAVFFVTMDYAKSNPDLVKRMVAEGHIVGNHSTTHPSMPKVSTEQQVEEISTLHNYLSENFSIEASLFRPPMGEFSEQSLAVTQKLGYRSVFWSFAYKDWDPDDQPEPDSSLAKLTQAAHDGAIYLLHAVSQTNTNILGEFIDTMRQDGYTFGSYPA